MSLVPCLNTSTIRPVPLAAKIPLIAAAGFRYVELWNDEIDAHLATGGTLADVRKRLDDSGLTVASVIALMGWADAGESDLPSVWAECDRRLEQAAAVGSKGIVVSPPGGDVPDSVMLDRLAIIRERAAQFGVEPWLEFLGFVDKYKTQNSVLSLARTFRPTMPIVSDTYHLMRGGGSLEGLLELKPSELGIFHINDLPANPPIAIQTDNDRVMLGEGTLDLPNVIQFLKKIGYEGPVSLELFNEKLWANDPASVLKTGFERLAALLV
jgi:sugar phosphate isomerase/epimerase